VTDVEILRSDFPRGRFRFAVFDFDGTLSLIREGWPQIMIPMMVEILRETGTAEDDGTERPAWAVDIDATTATSLERFDAYSLEACYGFHGFRVDRKELSSTLPDRPAEQIDYRDLPTRVGTFVLSWRQKVAGGRIERVVLSAPYAAGEVTAENAGLPDRATAAAAVTALGRTLAQAVSL
jgi:hypothetical protein